MSGARPARPLRARAPEPGDASRWVPRTDDLADLSIAASTCRGCELWRDATATVFGEGPASARVMLVGEQPGDREDREGRPFVGPAGRILVRGLDAAGLSRDDVYVTNAVKHFRHEQRGKKRIHRKPTLAHVRACEPWIREEIRIVEPAVLGLMGSTAARAVLGEAVRITEDRGRVFPTPFGRPAVITVHPSAILRIRDGEDRDAALASFVDDLRLAAREAARGSGVRGVRPVV